MRMPRLPGISVCGMIWFHIYRIATMRTSQLGDWSTSGRINGGRLPRRTVGGRRSRKTAGTMQTRVDTLTW
jgi:hypothetical protein